MTRQKLSKIMLGTNFVCCLFYAMSYPYIYAETLKVVSSRYISGEQIISCLGVVLLGILWNRKGEVLYKHFTLIIILELLADAVLFGHVLITGDLKFYFVLNVLIYAFLSRNVTNGGIKLRAKVHPDEKSRERYDINCNIVSSLATLLGSGFALLVPVSVTTLFVFALIGNTFDNICYYYIYRVVNRLAANAHKTD